MTLHSMHFYAFNWCNQGHGLFYSIFETNEKYQITHFAHIAHNIPIIARCGVFRASFHLRAIFGMETSLAGCIELLVKTR